MYKNFSDAARQTMSLAEQQARSLNQDYVGTEHILLALVADESCVTSQTLQSFGITAIRLRSEIERLITRGDNRPTAATVPLTPRANRVIEFAANEANFMNEKSVGPEHLLLGLIREPDGVAGQALRNLGLELGQIVKEVFRIRLEQMKTVERTVRPVRATTAWKRKTREELLAHLTAIYDAENSRINDSSKAMQAAVNRFGDPAELACELESALPATQRRGYFIERLFGWRAPESAARYMLRQSIFSFVALTIVGVVVAVASVIAGGMRGPMWHAVRSPTAFLVLVPIVQFLLGLLYYKLRDAIFGPVWARRSTLRVIGYLVLIALIAFAGSFAFVAMASWSITTAMGSLLQIAALAAAVALAEFVIAQTRGPIEISDTLWACLDLNKAPRTETA
jgi:Clp amino terminal domain, pathogenicity island component